MLIALVGMTGAGKTTASEYLRDKHGFGYLRFGEVVERGAHDMGAVNEQNERVFREQIRKEFGMKALAVKAEPLIKELLETNKDIVMDGLYSWEEYEYLKALYPDLLLLHIYATPAQRYERLSIRKIRPLKREESRSRDIAELVNLNKGGPIALSDFMVVNGGNSEDLHSTIDNILELIKSGNFYRQTS